MITWGLIKRQESVRSGGTLGCLAMASTSLPFLRIGVWLVLSILLNVGRVSGNKFVSGWLGWFHLDLFGAVGGYWEIAASVGYSCGIHFTKLHHRFAVWPFGVFLLFSAALHRKTSGCPWLFLSYHTGNHQHLISLWHSFVLRVKWLKWEPFLRQTTIRQLRKTECLFKKESSVF